MHERLALEGTKQDRQDTVGSSGEVEAHFTFRGNCRRRNRIRRNGPLGGDHPSNV